MWIRADSRPFSIAFSIDFWRRWERPVRPARGQRADRAVDSLCSTSTSASRTPRSCWRRFRVP